MPWPVSLTVTGRSGVVDTVEADVDVAAFGGELGGVAEQVERDLLEPDGVARHPGRLGIDGARDHELARLGLPPDRVERVLDDDPQVDRALVDLELAGHDARDVEQIVDELRLHARVALDAGQGAEAASSPLSRPERSISTQPSIAVSGVRSSCESVARN